MPTPWVSRLFAVLAFVLIVNCTPTHPISKRQSSNDFVTGIDSRDEHGNVHMRREVRDLRANYPDQWTLYLLGLKQLQDTAQDEDLSYYGLAGIHGRPYQTWLGAPGISDKIGITGYCPHSMALFLGWHRPYLALFEQALYARMGTIVSKVPDDQIERWREAAYSFRMPYWDWAQGDQSGDVPDSFMTEYVTVAAPEGGNVEIKNPLYAYEFQWIPSGFESKWAQINRTVRWPATDDPHEPSRQPEFKASFVSLRRSIQDQTAIAFRRDTLNGFWEALEMVHGWVHGVIGGGFSEGFGRQGHMWPLEYSSYEPLFWLHHTNVDRLFALYQAQDPNAFLQPSDIGSNGNVFVEDNAVVDGDTPLLPFRRNPGSFWTTNEAMDWRLFGYDYPETQSANITGASATIARLYSGSIRGRLAAGHGQFDAAAHAALTDDGTYTDWTINTAAAPLDLPPTFVVQFSFVGDFSSDAVTNIGMWSVLMPQEHNKAKRSLRKTEKFAKRATAAEMTTHGTVSLTSSLLDQIDTGKLQSLDEHDVVPFLKDKLTWKVYSGDGTRLPDSSLDAISIYVASETARVPTNPNAPIEYDDNVVTHLGVTAGKMGGAS